MIENGVITGPVGFNCLATYFERPALDGLLQVLFSLARWTKLIGLHRRIVN